VPPLSLLPPHLHQQQLDLFAKQQQQLQEMKEMHEEQFRDFLSSNLPPQAMLMPPDHTTQQGRPTDPTALATSGQHASGAPAREAAGDNLLSRCSVPRKTRRGVVMALCFYFDGTQSVSHERHCTLQHYFACHMTRSYIMSVHTQGCTMRATWNLHVWTCTCMRSGTVRNCH
jgi:hypothetical protein